MAKKLPIRPHLRAWRLRQNWTLVALANRLGTGHSSVISWEQGKAGVDDATFAAIADAYGISVAELSADPADAERSQALHRLMQAVRVLDDGKLARLADLAEDLAPPKPTRGR